MTTEKKGKMVKRQLLKRMTIGGKERGVGDIVSLSPENAEIFKDRLCEPGKGPSADSGGDGKLQEELDTLIAKVTELETSNKGLSAEKDTLIAKVTELEKAAKAK